jgi:hypothetical protein
VGGSAVRASRALNVRARRASTGCLSLDAFRMTCRLFSSLALIGGALLGLQASAAGAQEMPGMDMSSSATAMQGESMQTSHMTMTTLAPMREGDSARAAAIADTVGRAI